MRLKGVEIFAASLVTGSVRVVVLSILLGVFLAMISSESRASSSGDLLVCQGDGFSIALGSNGKLRVSDGKSQCELDETKVLDHRRSAFSHLQLMGIKRNCNDDVFKNWLSLIEVKLLFTDKIEGVRGQVIGRKDLKRGENETVPALPSCRLEKFHAKKMELFFSSKRE